MNKVILEGTVTEAFTRTGLDGTPFLMMKISTDENTSVPVNINNCDTPPAEGDMIRVEGKVRTRFFRAGGAAMSRTEVMAPKFTTVAVANV